MLMYSITGMNMEHVDEICMDLKRQQEERVSDYAMLMMYFTADGTPPVDKAEFYCKQYDVFREKLDAMGVKHGVLVQATLGHGVEPNENHPFQRFHRLMDGGVRPVCCPYDEGFREYIKNQMRTLAKHHPPVIMIDDDNGIIYRGKGCCCPLHMKELSRRIGREMTREELWAHTQGDSEEDRYYTKVFIETQGEALVAGVKAMREGIDSVDPTIQGIISTAGNYCEFTEEMAAAFAGQNNPKIVRINNGNYTPAGARFFTMNMLRAATQREILGDKIDMFLAETDTCPQNRYSTGAQSLHSHMTGTILEGAKGAKHWITRVQAYEPASGEAYRKILGKHRGFYEKLGELVDAMQPVGCRIPLSTVKDYGMTAESVLKVILSGWACCVLERFGVPLYFSGKTGGAVFFDDDVTWKFTDEEIYECFKGPVFLSAKAAKALNERGFSKYIGVDVRPWEGKLPNREIIYATDQPAQVQIGVQELVPLYEDVKWDSEVIHIEKLTSKEALFPGSTIFKNPLGGTTFVFSGTPHTEFRYAQAFSFLNESRKKQFVNMLKSVEQIPVYYPGDIDIYMRAGYLPDKSLLCAMFNISLDPLEEITLILDRPAQKIEKLASDGSRVICQFYEEDGVTHVTETAHILNPVVLIIS